MAHSKNNDSPEKVAKKEALTLAKGLYRLVFDKEYPLLKKDFPVVLEALDMVKQGKVKEEYTATTELANTLLDHFPTNTHLLQDEYLEPMRNKLSGKPLGLARDNFIYGALEAKLKEIVSQLSLKAKIK